MSKSTSKTGKQRSALNSPRAAPPKKENTPKTAGTNTSRTSREHVQRIAPSEDWLLRGNVAHYFSRIINKLNLDLADKVRELDISAQHYRVLQILYFGDGITIGALSKRIVIRLPVLSRVLNQMEERELLIRRPSLEDARYTNIFLTPKGVEMYEKAWPAAKPLIDNALKGLTQAQLQTLLSLVQIVDSHIND